LKLVRLNPIAPTLDLSEGELRRFLADLNNEATSDAGAWVLNLVCTPDGQTVGSTGSSRDLTNPADYAALMGLRDASDLILTSAKTARMERYRQSSTPLVLVSRSGDFTEIPALDQLASGEVKGGIYLVGPTQDLSEEVRSKLAGTFDDVEGFASLAKGKLVAVEAGPELASVLIRLGLVTRLSLSVVGVAAGQSEGETSLGETSLVGTRSPTDSVAAIFGILGIATATNTYSALVPEFETLLTQWQIQALRV
jgi:riboflavin biosynthesis pyrimidine reductase